MKITILKQADGKYGLKVNGSVVQRDLPNKDVAKAIARNFLAGRVDFLWSDGSKRYEE